MGACVCWLWTGGDLLLSLWLVLCPSTHHGCCVGACCCCCTAWVDSSVAWWLVSGGLSCCGAVAVLAPASGFSSCLAGCLGVVEGCALYGHGCVAAWLAVSCVMLWLCCCGSWQGRWLVDCVGVCSCCCCWSCESWLSMVMTSLWCGWSGLVGMLRCVASILEVRL